MNTTTTCRRPTIQIKWQNNANSKIKWTTFFFVLIGSKQLTLIDHLNADNRLRFRSTAWTGLDLFVHEDQSSQMSPCRIPNQNGSSIRCTKTSFYYWLINFYGTSIIGRHHITHPATASIITVCPTIANNVICKVSWPIANHDDEV